MRVIFMGTPEFAVAALTRLAERHDIAAVYTQPPRPAGRGQAARKSPVHQLADARGWPVRTPASLKSDDEQAVFAALNADIAVVAAYGLILPRGVLDAPRLGCVNIHASLLPRWRGAAPIQRAIMAGDTETGVTIMQMEAGLDTGPMLLARAVPITDATTAGELHDTLAALGAELIVAALDGLATGTLAATAQPVEGVTYAAKIDKAEAHVSFDRPAPTVVRHIHGLSPFPGAWVEAPMGTAAERLKVLRAERAPAGPTGRAPGELLDDRFTVACADGAVRLTQVQRAGKAAVDAAAFLRGFPLPAGTRLA
ncbi:MAG: methionyl-tRNA formyltransferase [Rhodospirillaceae bacterium]|nr:methionyl-tRNA formyltransferase [Rhodospirillaceae bacterium]